MGPRLLILGTIALLTGCGGSPRNAENTMKGSVSYLNPEGLHKSPAYSQAVLAKGTVRTVYVGGQNSVDPAGAVVGKGNIGTQAEQVAKNLKVALAAGGARAEQVVKWNVYVVQGQAPEPAMMAFQKVLGPLPNPPIITVLYVAGLAHPDFLLEVDAIAVVPEK
jgi:enamine deaminase RidA (YjgF/YER057c/UK114 family)